MAANRLRLAPLAGQEEDRLAENLVRGAAGTADAAQRREYPARTAAGLDGLRAAGHGVRGEGRRGRPAPTVATAAAATSSLVTGTTASLPSGLGYDDGGADDLKYTWAATYPGTGANAARNTTVTFRAAGSYTFMATITSTGGLSVTSSVTVTVDQTLSRINISPSTP